jgi:Tol biopolymer transport system component
MEVERIVDFHGGFCADPLFKYEASEQLNMELGRDGELRSIQGSTKINANALTGGGGTRVLSVFIGQAGAHDFVILVHTDANKIWAATSKNFPVTFTDITGAAALTGGYFSFTQSVDSASNQIILMSNDTDGMYKWTGTGNIAAIAAAPAARVVTLYQNYTVGIVQPNQIHFSEYQDPDTWPGATNVYELSGESGAIESAFALPGKLVLLCREGIHYVLGNVLEEFTFQKIYPNVGTIYPRCSVSYGQLAGFLTAHGPYLVSEGAADIQFIGDPLREYFSAETNGPWSTDPVDYTAYMNQYHFIITRINAHNGDSESLVYDLRYKAWWRLKPPAEIAPTCWAVSHAQAVGTSAYPCGLAVGGDVTNYTELTINDASLSPSGRYVAMIEDAADDTLYIRDLARCQTDTILTVSGGLLTDPMWAADDNRLVYVYSADGAAVNKQVYYYDINSGTSTLASTSSAGVAANNTCANPSISADGRYIAFASDASNLVSGAATTATRIYIKDTLTGDIQVITNSGTPVTTDDVSSISASGKYVAYATNTALTGADTNGTTDVYRYDRVTGTSVYCSQSTGGTGGNARSLAPRMSTDGSRVVFYSEATNLVAGDTNAVADVFLRDITAGTTTRLSLTTGGVEQDAGPVDIEAWQPEISLDGKWCAFESTATNLVAGDTNGVQDIFLRDIATPVTTRVSVHTDGTEANARCDFPGISEDGRYVLFQSNATNLVDGGPPAAGGWYIHDRLNSLTAIVSVS